MLELQELLYPRGLPQGAKTTKLVRHQDARWDLQRLSPKQFDAYQALQSKPVFNCKFIVAFIGQSYGHARLVGVYSVHERSGPGEFRVPDDFLYPDMPVAQYRYDLRRVEGYEDLERRVVIDWGPSTRSWHQWMGPREVIEVLPRGYVTEFPGYDDFILTFEQLCEIVDNPTANREWHSRLAALAGIYLLSDTSTGQHYVGSACGSGGILGRWRVYAATGHGGNRRLQELIAARPDHARHFTFTLLKTLPKTLTAEEVLEEERLYKRKLGSLVHGLNAN